MVSAINPPIYFRVMMKGTLTRILSALLQRQSQNTTDNPNRNAEEQLRCEQILNYWLDSELFDLPECPMGSKEENRSWDATEFLNQWGESANQRYLDDKLQLSENAKLVVMFQCHRAGYLLDKDESHPNYHTPLTFLVAQALIPKWDESRQTITWTRSDDDSDLCINLATIRTLYRRCPNAIPSNMTLSEWVEARFETIETRIANAFDVNEAETVLDTNGVAEKIKHINRELANEFWPDASSRKFMLERTAPVETQLADDEKPKVIPTDGTVTFRWRFCFYSKGNDNSQLGPFFVEDLESSIKALREDGISKGLSTPLQRYLLGKKDQTEIASALKSVDILFPLTRRLPPGRWPEKPEYGLSLLQTIAVNVAAEQKQNPVVAVNGPPGTGKTTLLKDIIAERFVARTDALLELASESDWLLKPDASEVIMSSSIVVASSNNKAVENISKELPSLSKLAKQYRDETKHFRGIAQDGDWGLFCAVLGKSENRTICKAQLKAINKHLKNLTDHFQFSYFLNSLRKGRLEKSSNVITKFVGHWQKNGDLLSLIEEIDNSKIRTEHQSFFKAFNHALSLVAEGSTTLEDFANGWKKLSQEQFDNALEAIDRLRRQWFARKLSEKAIKNKLKEAKAGFYDAKKAFEQAKSDIHADRSKQWGLESKKHLLDPSEYRADTSGEEPESPETAESRLQTSSPFGSQSLNHCRTNMFIASLTLNEALIEYAASEFDDKVFDDLASLIDGRLETHELTPHHEKLWSVLFLFFPVASTSLASVQNQFKLMQKVGGFGLAMFDESGQAVNYHVTGLLQRSRQAIFVGDPIQLEPVVAMPEKIDLSIARDFMPISGKDGDYSWGDDYRIAASSAQSIADKASRYIAEIGKRTVGIPLLVHRRCTDPMFSIANKIAYSEKMVLASEPFKWKAIQSGWIHVDETADKIHGVSYYNKTEASVAFELVKYLCETQPAMVKGGVYLISPFKKMSYTLAQYWNKLLKDHGQHQWMQTAFGEDKSHLALENFAEDNIGTVHTFQGKEASTVIFCTAASKIRNNTGGITWVNSKPNLINVAVTRAKHHLFVIGNMNDWEKGVNSQELQEKGMRCYSSIEELMQTTATNFGEHKPTQKPKINKQEDSASFDQWSRDLESKSLAKSK